MDNVLNNLQSVSKNKAELLLLLYMMESHLNLSIAIPYDKYSSIEELTRISKIFMVMAEESNQMKNFVYAAYIMLEHLLLKSGDIGKISWVVEETKKLDNITSSKELTNKLISVIKHIHKQLPKTVINYDNLMSTQYTTDRNPNICYSTTL
jgi:hypothetical protein